MKTLCIALMLLMSLPCGAALAKGAPTFTDAYVHDPSIIKADDGHYYIYGSHMAAAKSEDLMHWEMISSDAKDGCTLVDDAQNQMQEALSWAQTDTFWAPDVQQLKDGRYYMYYCTCEGSSPLSAMGLAIADDPQGPFVDQGIFLRSGMQGMSEDGIPYDATVHPNVIDAHVFYDNQGALWMVYGSYSGGIFILQMDDETGLPLPDQGYGKKLLGKNHSRIEGPYILYAPDTDYYYLFLSFGGLDASGGYNIRVCRSKSPDGPYLDANGQDMVDCGGADGTYFDDKAIEPYGTKLMGGFRFMPLSGFEALPEQAYKSPGHNSALYDPDTGRYFLIMHTRFSQMGDDHRVRVHPFWFDDAGWPLVSPLRYGGDAPSTGDPLSGDWRLLLHERDINTFQHRSSAVQFLKDGQITGELVGSWDEQGSITIDGESYQGVFERGYDREQQAWVWTISMLSQSGEALWGIRG
ncbi:glycoside hydrolase family 43 protein [Eubacteriales bacterium OttesenSCG-928-N13]|nr:glycoside hydrolase family 43 protein [Eubacteriales bacterium OttesenSCG-928-N13]